MLLPKVLNKAQIGRLFNVLTNRKHKAIISSAYRVAIRVSELACLKLRDIDSVQMQFLILQVQGEKTGI